MTAPAGCPHDTTEPVYAYIHGANVQVGDRVLVVNGGAPVARVCTTCRHLVRPCQEHA